MISVYLLCKFIKDFQFVFFNCSFIFFVCFLVSLSFFSHFSFLSYFLFFKIMNGLLFILIILPFIILFESSHHVQEYDLFSLTSNRYNVLLCTRWISLVRLLVFVYHEADNDCSFLCSRREQQTY